MRALIFFSLCFAPLCAQVTTVESQTAHYNEAQVVLEGNVKLHHILGEVTADKAVLTRDEKKLAKIDFPWLELTGHVKVALSNGRCLECTRVECDYIKLTSYFFGAPDVFYQDEEGVLYAQQADVIYRESEGKLEPVKITLKGEVRMRREGQEHLEQYAIADIIEYLPDDQTLVLEAVDDKRVLFFDKAKGMELTAKKVIAKRIEGKDSVQGVGDVSLIFKEEELAKMKGYFIGKENFRD